VSLEPNAELVKTVEAGDRSEVTLVTGSGQKVLTQLVKSTNTTTNKNPVPPSWSFAGNSLQKKAMRRQPDAKMSNFPSLATVVSTVEQRCLKL
jgi:hypothetical protein